MKYYLIGQNIETSLSPRIHNFLFKLKGLKEAYQPAVSGKLFTLKQMQDRFFGGTSVTIPFKKSFDDPHILKVGDLAAKHGVINTIYKNEERKLIAVNTDIFGISQCFGNHLQRIDQPHALIIGAGATSEIFCHYFQEKQFKTSLINRSSQRMEQLKEKFSSVVDFFPLRPDFSASRTAYTYSVIVNTLPSEVVYENQDHIELHLKTLFKNYPKNKSRLLYMNVNYRVKLDPIQQLMKSQLNLFVEPIMGINMLLWQALEQNRYFCLEPPAHPEQFDWQMRKLKDELHLPH